MKKLLFSFILVTALSNCLNAQGDPPQDPCLIAKYYFNSGNVNDDHSGGYHGKQVGATLVTDRFGNPNSAWYLNGTPYSYLNLGTYSALKPTTLSVSMWFNVTAPEYSGSGYSYNPLLVTKCQTGNNCYEAYCLYYSYVTNKIGGANTQLFCNQPCVWTSSVTITSWHHVVLTFDNSTLTMYLDAVPQGTVSKGFASIYLASDSVMVGNSANVANSRYFHGAVDDIRFYNCVIDQTKVTSLFNESNPLSTTGINSVKNETKVAVYPSPTSGEFTVILEKQDENAYLEIFNDLGQMIKQERLALLQNRIDISSESDGIYLLKIYSGNSFATKKLIKE